jgi:hypothetical protein
MPNRNRWLWLPVVLTWLFNNAVTLLYQPPAYWSGDYVRAQEAAPIALWLLKLHPLAFEAGMLAFLLFVCFALKYVSRSMAITLTGAIVLGLLAVPLMKIADHRPLDGYWICLAISVVAAVFLMGSVQMTIPPDPIREMVHENLVPQSIAERFRQELGDLDNLSDTDETEKT